MRRQVNLQAVFGLEALHPINSFFFMREMECEHEQDASKDNKTPQPYSKGLIVAGRILAEPEPTCRLAVNPVEFVCCLSAADHKLSLVNMLHNFV
ncbi:MAG: hypothetical protein LBU32_21245 [Clostridiales bacterium]|nr:hypothetical protein [Clostridiales bacterium]